VGDFGIVLTSSRRSNVKIGNVFINTISTLIHGVSRSTGSLFKLFHYCSPVLICPMQKYGALNESSKFFSLINYFFANCSGSTTGQEWDEHLAMRFESQSGGRISSISCLKCLASRIFFCSSTRWQQKRSIPFPVLSLFELLYWQQPLASNKPEVATQSI